MNNQNQNNWHGNTLLGRIRRIVKKRQIVLAVGGCLGIIFVSVIAANFVGKRKRLSNLPIDIKMRSNLRTNKNSKVDGTQQYYEMMKKQSRSIEK